MFNWCRVACRLEGDFIINISDEVVDDEIKLCVSQDSSMTNIEDAFANLASTMAHFHVSLDQINEDDALWGKGFHGQLRKASHEDGGKITVHY